MKGTEVFDVLKDIGATLLHHANSVMTSNTFLEQGGLASRGMLCPGRWDPAETALAHQQERPPRRKHPPRGNTNEEGLLVSESVDWVSGIKPEPPEPWTNCFGAVADLKYYFIF